MQPTKLIERERTPVALMLYGVYLYYASISLRLASRALERITRRSHVAIWKLVQRFAPVAPCELSGPGEEPHREVHPEGQDRTECFDDSFPLPEGGVRQVRESRGR